MPPLVTQVQGIEGHLKDIQAKPATLKEYLQEDEDGCYPGLSNFPQIICAACIHELRLLI